MMLEMGVSVQREARMIRKRKYTRTRHVSKNDEGGWLAVASISIPGGSTLEHYVYPKVLFPRPKLSSSLRDYLR